MPSWLMHQELRDQQHDVGHRHHRDQQRRRSRRGRGSAAAPARSRRASRRTPGRAVTTQRDDRRVREPQREVAVEEQPLVGRGRERLRDQRERVRGRSASVLNDVATSIRNGQDVDDREHDQRRRTARARVRSPRGSACVARPAHGLSSRRVGDVAPPIRQRRPARAAPSAAARTMMREQDERDRRALAPLLVVERRLVRQVGRRQRGLRRAALGAGVDLVEDLPAADQARA